MIAIGAGKDLRRLHSTGGLPNGGLFDSNGILYCADFGHGAVLAIQDNGQQEVDVY